MGCVSTVSNGFLSSTPLLYDRCNGGHGVCFRRQGELRPSSTVMEEERKPDESVGTRPQTKMDLVGWGMLPFGLQ